MVVKVKDGTRGEVSLCTTRRFAHNIKGTSDSQEQTYCSQIGEGKAVPFKVVNCDAYENKATPTIYAMREIAWVLSTDKQKKYGFHSPKDWRKQREEDGL